VAGRSPSAPPSRRQGGVKTVRPGVWRVDVELPRLSGEPRRRVSRTVVGSQQEAEQALSDLRSEVTNTERPKRSGHTLRVAARQRGSGGLRRINGHTWKVSVEASRDPVTGRRRRQNQTVHGSRADAEAVLARMRLRLASAPGPGTSARTLRAACDLYLDEARTERTTIRTDRSACNTICATRGPTQSTFGDMPLSRLDWKTVEQLYGCWNETLTPQARSRYASTLTKVLEHAKRTGWIDTNPARDARRPRVPTHRPDVPARSDVRRALDTAQRADPTLYAYVLGLATIGCRRSELLALRLTDIDLTDRVIAIRSALADGGPGVGVYVKPTKRSDWRDVPITEQIAEALEQLIDQRRCLLDEDPPGNGFVFSDSIDGSTPLRPDSMSHRWLAGRGASDVTFAKLRRFVATELLDATNGDYRTVSSITGNSEETLRRWYDAGANLDKKKAVIGLRPL
jgi:integrase